MPTAVLFGRVWQDNSGRQASTAQEQKGVEYLNALAPLLNSLVEYQSSAAKGVPAAPDTLKSAISKITEVDGRLGADLKTKDRWAALQGRIGKLAKASGGQLAVFQAHAEAIGLVLALYDTVRRNSQLSRDPDNDLSNLQQAVAVDMPSAVRTSNEMGDLAYIVSSTPASRRGPVAVQFGESVLQVQATVTNLTDNLQAAVEDTRSKTLSGGLVTTLDQFRRAIESMNRGVNLGGEPNIATIAVAQSSLQSALNTLASVTLHEMGKLLDDRKSTLDYRRVEAIMLGLLAVVLTLGALILPALGRRREIPAVPAAPPPSGTSRDIVATTGPGSYYGAAPGAGSGPGPYDQMPVYGEVNPTRREQSGALR